MRLRFEEIVLYCDNHLLVVSKPAGIPSQRDETGDEDLLSAGQRYLAERFNKPGRVYLGLVHRLDRPVSGVLVLARTSKAASRLSEQFRGRDVEKRYVALVEGAVSATGRAAGFLKKAGRGVVRAVEHEEAARYAELSWQRIASLDGSTLLDISLITGRKHQIRFQLAEAGHPIAGDLRYGATTAFDGRNIALHGYLVAVDHPTSKARLVWCDPPPGSWGEARARTVEWLAVKGSRCG